MYAYKYTPSGTRNLKNVGVHEKTEEHKHFPWGTHNLSGMQDDSAESRSLVSEVEDLGPSLKCATQEVQHKKTLTCD